MQRSSAYDPPEYLRWRVQPEILRAYRRQLEADPDRNQRLAALTQDALLALYAGLLKNRLHDLVLKRWVRQGIISKAWLGTGEEATTIGPVHALRRAGPDRDIVAPMIRNAGACHEMGMSISAMLRGYLGTADSPSGGRDGHVGDLHRGVLPPISHVGDMVPVVAGIALSFRQGGADRVVLTWVGDGSTKAAPFHEGFNFAAVQRLPLVCIIQNNQVALGTRLEQHSAGSFADWPRMYGVPGGVFDGNNVLDAYAATRVAVDRARSGGGATLLVAETFRMGGHATHDEREARETFDPALFDYWGRRDPVGLYEAWLLEEGISSGHLEEIERTVRDEAEREAEEALESRGRRMPEGEMADQDVYGSTPS
jgi:TPP-dependent pyruvate/acetoin dehydrogenase alpha subunit